MTKMAAVPIYGENPSKSSIPEPACRFPQTLVCSGGLFVERQTPEQEVGGLILTQFAVFNP